MRYVDTLCSLRAQVVARTVSAAPRTLFAMAASGAVPVLGDPMAVVDLTADSDDDSDGAAVAVVEQALGSSSRAGRRPRGRVRPHSRMAGRAASPPAARRRRRGGRVRSNGQHHGVGAVLSPEERDMLELLVGDSDGNNHGGGGSSSAGAAPGTRASAGSPPTLAKRDRKGSMEKVRVTCSICFGACARAGLAWRGTLL